MINPPDYKSGFGGSYGVQADRMDNSALGWDHYESPERHPSQKGNLHLWVWFVWYNGNGSDKLSKQRKWLTDGTHDSWVLKQSEIQNDSLNESETSLYRKSMWCRG